MDFYNLPVEIIFMFKNFMKEEDWVCFLSVFGMMNILRSSTSIKLENHNSEEYYNNKTFRDYIDELMYI